MVEQISLCSSVHYIILGDLNAQNFLWGSTFNSKGGQIWEHFADDRELMMFATYRCQRSLIKNIVLVYRQQENL